jgi:hypothetical protein
MKELKLKLYKSIATDLVVLVTQDVGDFFSGVVVVGDDEEEVGTYEFSWNKDAFKPYNAGIIIKEKSALLKKGRKPIKNYSNDELYKVLEKVYENKKQVFRLAYTIIVRRLMDLENIGENKAKELVKQAQESLFIFKTIDKKYELKTINN